MGRGESRMRDERGGGARVSGWLVCLKREGGAAAGKRLEERQCKCESAHERPLVRSREEVERRKGE
eukprot:3812317-Pleurochrysis_carterae.AAC.1